MADDGVLPAVVRQPTRRARHLPGPSTRGDQPPVQTRAATRRVHHDIGRNGCVDCPDPAHTKWTSWFGDQPGYRRPPMPDPGIGRRCTRQHPIQGRPSRHHQGHALVPRPRGAIADRRRHLTQQAGLCRPRPPQVDEHVRQPGSQDLQTPRLQRVWLDDLRSRRPERPTCGRCEIWCGGQIVLLADDYVVSRASEHQRHRQARRAPTDYDHLHSASPPASM